MNKDSIYKIIGYSGEYNNNVKKAIRKLLKENHPDNHGNRRIFELINEVKKELEEGKISYKIDNNSTYYKNRDIDYNYCNKVLKKLKKEKKIYTTNIQKLKDKLKNCNIEYQRMYRRNIDLETYLLTNSNYINKLKKTKYCCIFFVILALLVFIVSITEKNTLLFILFTLLVIICILIIHKSFFIMQNIVKNSRVKLGSYVGINGAIRENLAQQEELKNEIHRLNKKLNNIENDIRFYNNILNNR